MGLFGGEAPASTRMTLDFAEQPPLEWPAWSPDGKLIAFTSNREGQPQIYVMNADGSGKKQVTSNRASNFAPFFHPDGRRIIFSSNVETRNEKGRPSFHLYLVNDDGTGLERITTEGRFNSFPMFSPDGKRLAWVSDRHAKEPGEFNVFLADWIP